MRRILIVECMQEISSFNPLPSRYENFDIDRGDGLYRQRGRNTAIGGALSVFDGHADIETVPTISARAGSAGILSAAGWERLSREILEAVEEKLRDIDGIYVSLHGAMGAEGELDPEGFLLARIREMAGEAMPISISLDLHGILTERMIGQVDAIAIYHTYPHVDFGSTGARAARLLLDLLDGKAKAPVVARAVIPALVRGDELITKSGCYGTLVEECRRLEREGSVLSAGIMIGNPFTDVPELCSQVVIVTDGDEAAARREAERLADEFWPLRHRMQGKLIAMDRAIAQAKAAADTVCFTDAADATSSGASGDSNAIIAALRQAGYRGRVLAQIVDAPAAEAAHRAGVGATIDVSLGGSIDPDRFTPIEVEARVKLLSDGTARLETMQLPLDAGRTAVLEFDNFTVVAMSRTVSLFDRAMYYANGLDPRGFDLVVVKSPHTEYHMYDQWIERNFNIDAPGATSADVKNLGHTICARPIYPLDPDIDFSARAVVFRRPGKIRQAGRT